MHEELGEEYAIWGVGHAGHDIPPGYVPPSVKGSHSISPTDDFVTVSFDAILADHPELYTLEGQVIHKECFINQYVPKDVKLYLIGHSIGAKICTELLARFSASSAATETQRRQASAYLLFPTLERMADTPNGRRLWPILGPLRRPVVLAASLLYRLPESWLTALVRWFLGTPHVPYC